MFEVTREVKVAETAHFAIYARTPKAKPCCDICGGMIAKGEDTVSDGINHVHLDCLYGDMTEV